MTCSKCGGDTYLDADDRITCRLCQFKEPPEGEALKVVEEIHHREDRSF